MRAGHGCELDAIAEEFPPFGQPRSHLLEHFGAKRGIGRQGRKLKRVHPRDGRDVADRRRLRIALREQLRDVERIAPDSRQDRLVSR
jgi:hypothetical protein